MSSIDNVKFKVLWCKKDVEEFKCLEGIDKEDL